MSEVAVINGATVTGDLPVAALPARRSSASPGLKMAATDLATLSTPIAAIRLTMNALSSAGGKVTATVLQAEIGRRQHGRYDLSQPLWTGEARQLRPRRYRRSGG
jgi:hypothetical protein